MATPLHDVEALVALAEGASGPARDWATTRLAYVAPDRFRVFPTGDGVHDVVLAAAPPALVPAIVRALHERPVSVSLAATVCAIGAFGALPVDGAPLVAALRGALSESGTDADAWLALALATLGEADGRALAAAARSGAADAPWILPVVVMKVGEKVGALDEAAREVARGIAAASARDPQLLRAVLGPLGVPVLTDVGWVKEPEEAAKIGARIGGGHLPEVRGLAGSRKRRAQQWVLALLDGAPGPGPALLRALFRDQAHDAWGMWPVAIAAWIRCLHSHGALHDVLEHAAGADVEKLSQARREAVHREGREIEQALQSRADPTLGVVAMPAVLAGDAQLAWAVIDLLRELGPRDVRLLALAQVAAWTVADRVPDLLRDRVRRDTGLLLAEYVPTEEVLAALLELEVPADESQRVQYAQCLAAMGDLAAVPVLAALSRDDERGLFAEALTLAESVLGAPIA